jgi:hypothetical protein
MTDKDLGQMYMYNDRALIARSSSKILFFKRVIVDDDDKEASSVIDRKGKAKQLGDGSKAPSREWRQYFELSIRGFIYFIRGNKRIQVTSDDKIYFYLMDPETLLPELENVMANYMGCN